MSRRPGTYQYTSAPGVTSGSSFNVGMEWQPYTSGGGASYTLDGTLVYYGGFNHSLDASIEDIIAPTDYEGHYRENPRNGHTTVRIRNSGSTVINNVSFQYGVTGSALTTATWTGNIDPLKDTIIDLPLAASLLSATGTGLPYEINITAVNGIADNDATNNKMTSTFTAAPEWTSKFMVTLRTNKAVAPSGKSETEWRIYDLATGAIAAQRTGNAISSVYTDTVVLPVGVYKFEVTDAGCDGVNSWIYALYSVNPGAGSIGVKPTLYTTTTITAYMGGDFGCGFIQYFRVGTPSVAIEEVNAEQQTVMDVYPNPASGDVTVRINSNGNASGILHLMDNTGRVVWQQQTSGNNTIHINTGNMAHGMYYVRFIPDGHSSAVLLQKLVIVK